MKRKTILFLILLFVILIIASYFFYSFKNKKTAVPTTSTPTPNIVTSAPISATFNCKNNTYIKAKFYNKDPSYVELVLSTGKNITLSQSISASGARYTNTDETFVFWNKGDTAFIEENGRRTFDNCQTTSDNSQTPTTTSSNPASVNCVNKGGQSQIKTKPDGNQYGLCLFEDNQACEEWAMLNGECPVGGRRTTGFDTDAQKFCAWSGGQTFAVDNAICTFSDGSTCPDNDFYSDTCQKGIKK
jgi:membrane-bound inhibitor of C-type lysozyme